MNLMPVHPIPLIEPKNGNEEIEIIFDEILRITESPTVTNMWRTLANSLPALCGTWQLMKQVFFESNLPLSLKAMILFSISAANRCAYCGAVMEVTCRTVGVEEDTLKAIVNDLDSLNPERVRVIIGFARRCAKTPYAITEADYDMVRGYGITDEELVEIVSLAAVGNYFDTLADALKLEADAFYTERLPDGQLVR